MCMQWCAVRLAVLVTAACVLAACGLSVQEQWARPGAALLTRLAVLPFENQTPALRAGVVASDLLVSELLATGAVGLMDPSEVTDLLRRDGLDPGDVTHLPSAQRLGRILQVSHVLKGSVTEFRYKPGLSETPVVGITARVVDVASGEVVWTASQARSGSSWFREDGLARLAQVIVRDMAQHLTQSLSRAR